MSVRYTSHGIMEPPLLETDCNSTPHSMEARVSLMHEKTADGAGGSHDEVSSDSNPSTVRPSSTFNIRHCKDNAGRESLAPKEPMNLLPSDEVKKSVVSDICTERAFSLSGNSPGSKDGSIPPFCSAASLGLDSHCKSPRGLSFVLPSFSDEVSSASMPSSTRSNAECVGSRSSEVSLSTSDGNTCNSLKPIRLAILELLEGLRLACAGNDELPAASAASFLYHWRRVSGAQKIADLEPYLVVFHPNSMCNAAALSPPRCMALLQRLDLLCSLHPSTFQPYLAPGYGTNDEKLGCANVCNGGDVPTLDELTSTRLPKVLSSHSCRSRENCGLESVGSNTTVNDLIAFPIEGLESQRSFASEMLQALGRVHESLGSGTCDLNTPSLLYEHHRKLIDNATCSQQLYLYTHVIFHKLLLHVAHVTPSLLDDAATKGLLLFSTTKFLSSVDALPQHAIDDAVAALQYVYEAAYGVPRATERRNTTVSGVVGSSVKKELQQAAVKTQSESACLRLPEECITSCDSLKPIEDAVGTDFGDTSASDDPSIRRKGKGDKSSLETTPSLVTQSPSPLLCSPITSVAAASDFESGFHGHESLTGCSDRSSQTTLGSLYSSSARPSPTQKDESGGVPQGILLNKPVSSNTNPSIGEVASVLRVLTSSLALSGGIANKSDTNAALPVLESLRNGVNGIGGAAGAAAAVELLRQQQQLASNGTQPDRICSTSDHRQGMKFSPRDLHESNQSCLNDLLLSSIPSSLKPSRVPLTSSTELESLFAPASSTEVPTCTNGNLQRSDTPYAGYPNVSFDVTHNRWIAFWRLNGRNHSKSFSCSKYGGREAARIQAVEFRKELDMRVFWLVRSGRAGGNSSAESEEQTQTKSITDDAAVGMKIPGSVHPISGGLGLSGGVLGRQLTTDGCQGSNGSFRQRMALDSTCLSLSGLGSRGGLQYRPTRAAKRGRQRKVESIGEDDKSNAGADAMSLRSRPSRSRPTSARGRGRGCSQGGARVQHIKASNQLTGRTSAGNRELCNGGTGECQGGDPWVQRLRVVSGSITFDRSQNRFMAQWKSSDGCKHSKSFYIKNYGSLEEAQLHALRFKENLLAERDQERNAAGHPTPVSSGSHRGGRPRTALGRVEEQLRGRQSGAAQAQAFGTNDSSTSQSNINETVTRSPAAAVSTANENGLDMSIADPSPRRTHETLEYVLSRSVQSCLQEGGGEHDVFGHSEPSNAVEVDEDNGNKVTDMSPENRIPRLTMKNNAIGTNNDVPSKSSGVSQWKVGDSLVEDHRSPQTINDNPQCKRLKHLLNMVGVPTRMDAMPTLLQQNATSCFETNNVDRYHVPTIEKPAHHMVSVVGGCEDDGPVR